MTVIFSQSATPDGTLCRGDAELALPAVARRPELLLVDDDAMVRELMAEAMQHLGFDVAQAEDAAAALAWFAAGGAPDMMITDYSMPEMNGLELIERVQRTHPVLPIILLTGHADPEMERVLAKLTGAKAVLLGKPVRPRDLSARVKAMIG